MPGPTQTAILLALALSAPGLGHAASLPSCPPPQPADIDPAPLTNLAAVLKPPGTLAVLAVGSALGQEGASSATPAGAPPTKPSALANPAIPPAPTSGMAGFPLQMGRALEASVPGLHVNVTVRTGKGLDAADQQGLILSEISRHRYQLVLWQTGTVDAVRETPPGDFYQTLADTAAAVTGSGADLVLVDPQYSRFLEANANLAPYEDAMQTAGALPGTVLFHRYDLMRDWVDAGLIDLERTPRATRQATAAKLHACLGKELARSLLADIGLAK